VLDARDVEWVDPAELLDGTVLLTAPHMDDGVLACGATLARLPDRSDVHILYATDGSRSPAPTLPWIGSPGPEIRAIRRDEARAALARLGVPPANVQFADLPDGRLRRHESVLRQRLTQSLERLKPRHLLVPFRFDRHPDHLAVHRAALAARDRSGVDAAILEYFVYYRWRLLPGGDVRRHVRADRLLGVDGREHAEIKRQALDCFVSQTTRFYAWQDRAILTAELLDEVCAGPEYLVRSDPALPGAAICSRLRWWIPLAHRLEPFLKRRKDEALALLRGGGRRDAGTD